MITVVRFIPALLIALAACTDAPTSANSVTTPAGPEPRIVPTGTPEGCPVGTTGASGALPGSGALYLICVPPGFGAATGSLVLYAPGSVPPQVPLAIRDDAIDGQRVSQIITGLGIAFATTSYRENGLIIVEGARDLQRLAAKFQELYGPLGGATYGVGVSEGAQVVTLATERHPQLFDGALAACGPIGDFRRQLNYYGDVRLVFDLLFGPVLTPLLPQLGLTSLGPLDAVPEQVIQLFGTPSQPGPLALLIAQVVAGNPTLTNELLTRIGLPLQLDASNQAVVVDVVLRLLGYSILFGNNAAEVLGGPPYDNVAPVDYPRPIDGLAVPPYSASQPALSHLAAKYETSGRLTSPLVTLFNTVDPIIPSWQETAYQAKVEAAGTSELLVAQIPVNRLGHCAFTAAEVLGAFAALVQAVTGQQLGPAT
jgi:pimeloyl-ACP methyl ester carboxylesterase